MRKILAVMGYVILFYVTFYLSLFYFSSEKVSLETLKVFYSYYPLMPDVFIKGILKNFNIYMDTNRLIFTYVLLKTLCTTLGIGVSVIFCIKRIGLRLGNKNQC